MVDCHCWMIAAAADSRQESPEDIDGYPCSSCAMLALEQAFASLRPLFEHLRLAREEGRAMGKAETIMRTNVGPDEESVTTVCRFGPSLLVGIPQEDRYLLSADGSTLGYEDVCSGMHVTEWGGTLFDGNGSFRDCDVAPESMPPMYQGVLVAVWSKLPAKEASEIALSARRKDRESRERSLSARQKAKENRQNPGREGG